MKRIVTVIAVLGLLVMAQMGQTDQIALQGAEATYDHGAPFSPGHAIDGQIVKDNGWLTWNGAQWAAQAIVFETTSDVHVSQLTFTLHQVHPDNTQSWSIRKTLFSYTTDDRSTFGGGDGTAANWIPLTPATAVALRGLTGAIQLDNSIEWSYDPPFTNVYTITVDESLFHVTGFRLDTLLLYGGAPPTTAVGYASGGFVLSEFEVDAELASAPGSAVAIR